MTQTNPVIGYTEIRRPFCKQKIVPKQWALVFSDLISMTGKDTVLGGSLRSMPQSHNPVLKDETDFSTSSIPYAIVAFNMYCRPVDIMQGVSSAMRVYLSSI